MTLPQALLRLAAERNYESARAAADAVRAEIRAMLAPDALPEPRPPTRLGNEFPDSFGPRRPILECNQCGNFPAQADMLREHHQIGDACPAGGLADRDCDGTLRKPSPEMPDRFEAVLGSDLREGDVLGDHGELNGRTIQKHNRDGGLCEVDRDDFHWLRIKPTLRYSRLVRPAPVEAEKSAPAETWWRCDHCLIQWSCAGEHPCPHCGDAPEGSRYETIVAIEAGEQLIEMRPGDSESIAKAYGIGYCGKCRRKFDDGEETVTPPGLLAADICKPCAQPTPVRVDSLPAGAKCWVRATVESREFGRVLDFGINGGLYFRPNELVVSSEPSPTVASETETAAQPPLLVQVGRRYRRRDGKEVECIRDDRDDIRATAGSAFTCRCQQGIHLGYFNNGRRWSVISDPADLVEDLGPVEQPLRLKVGERYERRDGVLTDCVAHQPEYAGQENEFGCARPDGRHVRYYANGRFTDLEHPVDIVRHVGPTPVPTPAAPEWADANVAETIAWLRKKAERQVEPMCASPSATEWHRRRNAAEEQLSRDMLKELAAALPESERKALLAEVGK